MLSHVKVEVPLGPPNGGDKIAVVFMLCTSEEIFEPG